MAWQRSENLATPHELSSPIPGTEALRQALLRDSWKRDRSVAQRRLLWRWVLYLATRYTPHLALLAALTIGALFVSTRWSVSSVLSHVSGEPSQVATITTESSPAAPGTGDTDGTPLHLKLGYELLPKPSQTPPARTAVAASTDTLSLKPENWLHSKEP